MTSTPSSRATWHRRSAAPTRRPRPRCCRPAAPATSRPSSPSRWSGRPPTRMWSSGWPGRSVTMSWRAPHWRGRGCPSAHRSASSWSGRRWTTRGHRVRADHGPGRPLRAAPARRHRQQGPVAGNQRSLHGIQAVQHLSVLLCMLAGRRLGDQLYHDEQETLRVAVPLPQFADYLRLGTTQIRRSGAKEPAVARSLIQLLKDVGGRAVSKDRRRGLRSSYLAGAGGRQARDRPARRRRGSTGRRRIRAGRPGHRPPQLARLSRRGGHRSIYFRWCAGKPGRRRLTCNARSRPCRRERTGFCGSSPTVGLPPRRTGRWTSSPACAGGGPGRGRCTGCSKSSSVSAEHDGSR
jgi:Predicted membrane protein (DUF2254)